ncbi:MAG: thiamine-phosphate kinase [Ferrimicrobium sp.]
MTTEWTEESVVATIITQLGTAYLGDDAAIIPGSPSPLALCADAIVEGVHFDYRYWAPEQIGAKAVLVNLSDLAAMGAIPRWILLTISAPATAPIESILNGVVLAAQRYQVPLIGGDTTLGPVTSLSVTAVGECPHGTLMRSGGQPGDHILVTGALGASSAGLARLRGGAYPDLMDPIIRAHLAPEPRILAGQLALASGATAAIDISDGFSLDLHRLADASKVGIRLHTLPVHPGATYADALGGGEDYELCLTTHDPERLQAAFHESDLPIPIEVGMLVDDPTVREINGKVLPRRGYLHNGASRPMSQKPLE